MFCAATAYSWSSPSRYIVSTNCGVTSKQELTQENCSHTCLHIVFYDDFGRHLGGFYTNARSFYNARTDLRIRWLFSLRTRARFLNGNAFNSPVTILVHNVLADVSWWTGAETFICEGITIIIP